MLQSACWLFDRWWELAAHVDCCFLDALHQIREHCIQLDKRLWVLAKLLVCLHGLLQQSDDLIGCNEEVDTCQGWHHVTSRKLVM